MSWVASKLRHGENWFVRWDKPNQMGDWIIANEYQFLVRDRAIETATIFNLNRVNDWGIFAEGVIATVLLDRKVVARGFEE